MATPDRSLIPICGMRIGTKILSGSPKHFCSYYFEGTSNFSVDASLILAIVPVDYDNKLRTHCRDVGHLVIEL